MKYLRENLIKKGWSELEINDLMSKLKQSGSHPNFHKTKSSFNKIVYWTSLLVLTVCNFIISIFLIPFLILFHNYFIYVIIIVLSLIFGYLFATIVNNIEQLERKHHLVAMILVPLISVLNIFFIIHISNTIDQFLNYKRLHDPLLIALIYALMFIGPYYLFLIFKKQHIADVKN